MPAGTLKLSITTQIICTSMIFTHGRRTRRHLIIAMFLLHIGIHSDLFTDSDASKSYDVALQDLFLPSLCTWYLVCDDVVI
jgi:hypothetical protein